MLAGAEEAGFTWPLISEDLEEFLTDCGCSLAKKNRRKKMKWGKPEGVLPEDNAFAVDLYSFGGKTYLSILNLKDDQFCSKEVWEKSSECITSLRSAWADYLVLNLCDLTFLSDRGGEFAELSAYLKDNVKTASGHPEANGKIEGRHKEVGMMCRLYECAPLLLLRSGDLYLLKCSK